MPSNRIDRISEEVMRCLSELMRTVKDPRISNAMISVTHCDVTNDLRWCKAYISILGDYEEKEMMRGLKSASGFLRRELAHKLSLRYTPELVFVIDDSIKVGTHISAILNALPKTQDEEISNEDENQ